MGWNDFTFAMGNIANVFRATNGVLDKSQGGTLGSRMQQAGIQLFGNSMALQTAKDIRANTGSCIGYTGFYAANGDASKAVQNTTDAALFATQMYTPMFYSNMRGTSSMYGMYNSYPTSTYASPSSGGFGTFNNKFFKGYWA